MGKGVGEGSARNARPSGFGPIFRGSSAELRHGAPPRSRRTTLPRRTLRRCSVGLHRTPRYSATVPRNGRGVHTNTDAYGWKFLHSIEVPWKFLDSIQIIVIVFPATMHPAHSPCLRPATATCGAMNATTRQRLHERAEGGNAVWECIQIPLSNNVP